MQNKKYPQKLIIAIIAIFIVIILYYFVADKPFGISQEKEITKEKLDSLKKMLPEEMFLFLTQNDSLKININSMADFKYVSKDSTIYDSLIKENKTHYNYKWNSNSNNWEIYSRYYYLKDTTRNFSVSVSEDYYPYNKSWQITDCDSFFRNEAGDFIMQKNSLGYIDNYFYSDNGKIETIINTKPNSRDEKTIKIKDKKDGKLLKIQEFSGDYSKDKWEFYSEKNYEYLGDKTTKTTLKKNNDNELVVISYTTDYQLNDSVSISMEYGIDSIGERVLKDSTIIIKNKNKEKSSKHYYFLEKQKLLSVDIDRNYYDSDSNRYYYNKSMNLSPRHGYISVAKYDSLCRVIYHKSHHWNNDSSKVHFYEKYGYYTPNHNIEINYAKSRKEGDKRIEYHLSIEFISDKFNIYETDLYWREDNKSYKVGSIKLKKLNNKGRVVETIEIR
ncbi:MAG: hypothetical protein JXR51_04780 [Bacteroidales bacterium]|nr:hypothetical protein [Bacteroidales bacterium]MBN2756473.1 hypothetical protein [Bacteroidales bacterium]